MGTKLQWELTPHPQEWQFFVPNHGKTTKGNGLDFEDNFVLAITLKLVQMF